MSATRTATIPKDTSKEDKMSDEVKAGIRKLLADKGRMVQFEEGWGGEPTVSTYGWHDTDSYDHIIGRDYSGSRVKKTKPCEWVIPEGTIVQEESYSQFCGTFTNNRDEVGLNAAGVSCKCGKYKDVTIRVAMSLGEAIKAIVGYDTTKAMKL